MSIEPDAEHRRHWGYVSVEKLTQAVDDNPRNGHIYDHLANLERSHSRSNLDTYIKQLFYYTKAIIAPQPFFPAQRSIFDCINDIVAPTKKEINHSPLFSPASTNPFLTAVAHLILAGQPHNLLEEKGYDPSKANHIEAFHRALEKVNGLPDNTQTQASTQVWKLRPRYV